MISEALYGTAQLLKVSITSLAAVYPDKGTASVNVDRWLAVTTLRQFPSFVHLNDSKVFMAVSPVWVDGGDSYSNFDITAAVNIIFPTISETLVAKKISYVCCRYSCSGSERLETLSMYTIANNHVLKVLILFIAFWSVVATLWSPNSNFLYQKRSQWVAVTLLSILIFSVAVCLKL